MVSRNEWAAEALRRGADHVRQTGPGCRNETLFRVAARMADYLRDGTLDEGAVERALVDAATSADLPGREARRTLRSALERGDADRAWYPTTGASYQRDPRPWWRQRVQAAWSEAAVPTCPYNDGEQGERVRLTTYRDRFTRQGSVEYYTWRQIEHLALHPLVMDGPSGKDGLPLWSAAELEGDNRGRRDDGVDRYGRKQDREPHCYGLHALMLDYDKDPDWSLAQTARWWGHVTYLAHTTASHTEERPRGRVLLALSRPLTPPEHAQVAEWAIACGRGVVGAQEVRTIARGYYVPADPGTHYKAEANLAGQAIDVDALLAQLATLEEEHAADDTTPDDAVAAALLRGPPRKDPDGQPIPHSGEPRRLLKNVRICMAMDPRRRGRYQLDEFGHKVLEQGEPISDVSLTRAQYWMADAYELHASLDHTQQVIAEQAAMHPIHPVRTYLNGLQWDGRERIDCWLTDYLGVSRDALHDAYGARWLISAVARIMTPGCQVDTVLVLQGKQGCGKSSTLRILASEAWFTDASIDFRSADAPRSLAGVWIYELAELDALARAEATAAKAFLSTRTDHYRPPYGRVHVDVPRQVVFAATTNDATFLRDATGSRRFWVVEVQQVDLAALLADRDQLWAEAVVRWRAGERWHLDGALEAEREERQEQYRMRDPWEDAILTYLDQHPQRFVTTTELLTEALELDVGHTSKAHEMRVAGILRVQGWERHKRRVGGVPTWGYLRAERSHLFPPVPTSDNEVGT